jgi:hypothetical protein
MGLRIFRIHSVAGLMRLMRNVRTPTGKQCSDCIVRCAVRGNNFVSRAARCGIFNPFEESAISFVGPPSLP